MNISTATEVRLIQAQSERLISNAQDRLYEHWKKLQRPVLIYSLLGFYKPTNKSRKPAARLRHSLTVRTAQWLDEAPDFIWK